MGSYAPAIPFDDEEDERRREDQPYPPVSMSSPDSEPSPYGSASGTEPHLIRRSGEPVDMSTAPAISAAPAGYPPIGSTEDLEQKASKLMPYHAVDPSPAEQRLTALTASGAPPVQPLHGFKKGLDILGQVVRPDIEQRLRYRPQNEYARNLKEAGDEVAAEQAPAAEQAKTSELQSRGEFEQAHADAIKNPPPKQKTDEEQSFESYLGQTNPETGKPFTPTEAFRKVKADAAGAKPEGQEQNKLAYQGIIGKLDAAGLHTDPKSIDKSLDAALKKGAITPAEHASARSYLAANPTPSNSFTVNLEGKQAGQNLKDENTKALVDDGNGGTRMGTVAEAKSSGTDYVAVKDEQTVANTGRLYNQIRRSTDRLADPNLLKIFDDTAARAIIATATSETEAQHFGILVPHIGGIMIPLPGGTGKFIDSVLQNYKGANKKELQEYLANFWEAREAAMNMMRLQTEGKQGARSQQQMNAVIAQLPGGQTPNKEMAALQLRNMFQNLDDYGRGVPDKLPGYEKYKPKQYGEQAKPDANNPEAFRVPDGAPAAPREDGHKLKSNGKVIAISKGGQWAPPQ